MTTEWELVGRVVVAALLGGLIGFDRQLMNKPAGIRTHMLVGAGAALFVAASILIIGDAVLVDRAGDAVRIPAAIVTGVGFLGAGAILQTGNRVAGLTTAAGIWVTSAVGVLVGSGFWVIAVGSTLILLVIVNITGWASSRLGIGDHHDAPPTGP
jgi:putative Mg2+ transporter-C (MgtC) family protein